VSLVRTTSLFCTLLGDSDLGTYDQCSDTFLIFIQSILKLFGFINAMIQPDWILVEGYDTTWVNFRISPAGRTDSLVRFIVLPASSWAANRTRTAFLIVSWHCSF